MALGSANSFNFYVWDDPNSVWVNYSRNILNATLIQEKNALDYLQVEIAGSLTTTQKACFAPNKEGNVGLVCIFIGTHYIGTFDIERSEYSSTYTLKVDCYTSTGSSGHGKLKNRILSGVTTFTDPDTVHAALDDHILKSGANTIIASNITTYTDTLITKKYTDANRLAAASDLITSIGGIWWIKTSSTPTETTLKTDTFYVAPTRVTSSPIQTLILSGVNANTSFVGSQEDIKSLVNDVTVIGQACAQYNLNTQVSHTSDERSKLTKNLDAYLTEDYAAGSIGAMSVDNVDSFDAGGGTVLLFDSRYSSTYEKITYTGISGHTLTGITRNVSSTTGINHVKGDEVINWRTHDGYVGVTLEGLASTIFPDSLTDLCVGYEHMIVMSTSGHIVYVDRTWGEPLTPYAHRVGVYGYNGDYSLSNPKSGSTIAVNGLQSRTFYDKSSTHVHDLDIIAQNIIDQMNPIGGGSPNYKIIVSPMNPYTWFTGTEATSIICGSQVKVLDAQSGLDGTRTFNVVKMTLKYNGAITVEYELNDSRLTLMNSLSTSSLDISNQDLALGVINSADGIVSGTEGIWVKDRTFGIISPSSGASLFISGVGGIMLGLTSLVRFEGMGDVSVLVLSSATNLTTPLFCISSTATSAFTGDAFVLNLGINYAVDYSTATFLSCEINGSPRCAIFADGGLYITPTITNGANIIRVVTTTQTGKAIFAARHTTSTFKGDGILLDFANGTGLFNDSASNFIRCLNNTVEKFKVDYQGYCTAVKFYGDGSSLTGISAGGWTRTGTVLSPTTANDTVSIPNAAITTGAILTLSQNTSAFGSSGIGLQMNFADGSGSFAGKFVSLVAGTEMFSISSLGYIYTASGYWVDNDGATTTNICDFSTTSLTTGNVIYIGVDTSAGTRTGNAIKINLPTGHTGSYLNCYLNNVQKFNIDKDGFFNVYNAATTYTHIEGTLLSLYDATVARNTFYNDGRIVLVPDTTANVIDLASAVDSYANRLLSVVSSASSFAGKGIYVYLNNITSAGECLHLEIGTHSSTPNFLMCYHDSTAIMYVNTSGHLHVYGSVVSNAFRFEGTTTTITTDGTDLYWGDLLIVTE